MGSYLSVENDTSDVWFVKLGPDQKAAKTALNVMGTVSSFTRLTTPPADANPAGNRSAPIAAQAVEQALSAAHGLTRLTTGVTETTRSIGDPLPLGRQHAAEREIARKVVAIQNEWTQDGFLQLPAHQKKRWGKLSLSLWQQVECRRVRTVEDTIYVASMFMRPVFSHALAGGEQLYYVSSWLENSNTEIHETALDQVRSIEHDVD